MIDITKKYKTRSGLDFHPISDKGRGEYPIIGFIADNEDIQTWTKDGVFHIGNSSNHLDLVEVKEKIVNYFSIYSIGVFSSRTRLEADLLAKKSIYRRFACIRVEYEEGQFDE